MQLILVGQRNGERQICWGAVALTSCVLAAFGCAGAAGVYFALSGTFSPIAAGIGFMGPIITIGSGVMRALQVPVSQLTPLDERG